MQIIYIHAPSFRRERDDLMKSVSSMRSSVMEAQKTESSLRKEVQKSLALVEDMQLEKAQAKAIMFFQNHLSELYIYYFQTIIISIAASVGCPFVYSSGLVQLPTH